MKRVFTLLALLVGLLITTKAQSELPTFSTADAPVYYLIKFKTGNAYLQDNGGDNLLVTKSKLSVNKQQFALIGTRDNFVLRSKSGRYVGMKAGTATNGSKDTFFCTVANESAATSLTLINNASNGYYEITKTDDTSKGMNQWGGGGDNRNLGLWEAGVPNNPLSFVLPADVALYDVKGIGSFTPERKHTLWYDRPATVTGVSDIWMEYSLPIGNGNFGASLLGGVKRDEIQFNEKTLWQGAPTVSAPYHPGTYKNFGSVFVKNLDTENFSFDNSKPAKDYVRFLDIERGVGGVDFTGYTGTHYTRRYIASAPAGVVAAYYTARGKDKLDLLFSVTPGEDINASAPVYADGNGTFHGKLQTISYAAHFKVINTGGKISTTPQGVEVKGADAVLLILTGGTTFDSSVDTRTTGTAADVAQRIKATVEAAARQSWESLFDTHVKNFESYMSRVTLNINDASSAKNTEELVKFYNRSANNKKSKDGLFLEQLYFNYGRYLLISSNRGGNAPNNLQGIWNNKTNPVWNSDIHTNINVQMNYWPTEPTNLSELHEPLLNYIIDNSKSPLWKKAAKDYGQQDKGWVVLTESNVFGGMTTWGENYFVANAWYSSHLWQHYRFTLDREYLKRAFPTMWGVAQFWMGRMIKDRGSERFGFQPDGTWVCPDEFSAEQEDYKKEDGTAHAQQLVTENLTNCLQAIEILGLEDAGISQADLDELNSYLEKIDRGLHLETYNNEWPDWAPGKGIKKGDKLLREWKYAPFHVSKDKGHRHMSHLMCLYPLSQVKPGDGFYEAAVNSLKLRGDQATGWSMGWKVNLWARAKDGDHAHRIIQNALKHSTDYGINQAAGGIYYNLYDSHAPFQIDGNFGVCSGIAEMLLQSHLDVVEILPALPSAWKNGEVTGLKAVGDFTVDITWKNGRPLTARIVSNKGGELRITSPTDLSRVTMKIGDRDAEITAEELTPNAQRSVYRVKNLQVGETLSIDFDKPSGIAAAATKVSDSDSNYDLTGRHIGKQAKGLMILNGKKVIR